MGFRHYFTDQDKAEKMQIRVDVRGHSLVLVTYRGLFSYKELDKGTRLLIENMAIPDSGAFCDLGCGYGVVGLIAALEKPNLEVWFVDISKLALMATKQNAKKYLRKFVVVRSNGLESVDKRFNAIATNPPFSAGKDTVFKFIEESFTHLVPGGWLDLVARTSKGGKSVKERMETIFGNVETVARGSGYQVYRSLRLKVESNRHS